MNSQTEIVNSILWNNTSNSGAGEISNDGTGFVNIRYSDVTGCGGSGTGWNSSIGIDGGGNIDTDPLFAGFYQLQSPAGRFVQSVEASWLFDDAVSPCIDAGDPAVVIGREPLPNGGIINIGAYGGTPQASKSSFETACDVLIAGDINGDCQVNLLDYSLMALHWLEKYEAAP